MNLMNHRFRSAKADGPDATQVQPSNWNDGHVFTGGLNGQTLVRDGSDGVYGATWANHGGLVAYTPTWGSTGTAPGLGNSQIVGTYTRIAQLVLVYFRLTIGSTATLGSGVWTFTLPPVGVNPTEFLLDGEVFNSAVGSYSAIATMYTGTQAVFYAAGAPNGVGPTLPFTFKAGDKITASGILFYPGL